MAVHWTIGARVPALLAVLERAVREAMQVAQLRRRAQQLLAIACLVASSVVIAQKGTPRLPSSLRKITDHPIAAVEDHGRNREVSLGSEEDFLFISGSRSRAEVVHSMKLLDGKAFTLSCPDWIDWSVAVSPRQGIPVIGRLRRCHQHAQKVIIWYHGGPFLPVDDNISPEQFVLLQDGYDVFIPYYPLSAERSLQYDNSVVVPDLKDAGREVRSAVDWAHGRYSQVYVLGESLGAVFASRALDTMKSSDRLILFNPFLGTLAELYSGLRPSAQVIRKKLGISYDELGRVLKLFSVEPSFSASMLTRLQTDTRVRLVYSSADRLVDGPELRALVTQLSTSCRVNLRPSGGHSFARSESDLKAFQALLTCREQD